MSDIYLDNMENHDTDAEKTESYNTKSGNIENNDNDSENVTDSNFGLEQTETDEFTGKKTNKKIVYFLAIIIVTVLVITVGYNYYYYFVAPYNEYKSAKEDIKDGDYEEGIDTIENLLNDNKIPDLESEAKSFLWDAKTELAEDYYDSGKAEKAFELYDELNDVDGMDKAKRLRAMQYIANHDYSEAEDIIENYFGDEDNDTVNELKYDYCKMLQDNSDDTFARYLWDLVEADYKDAKDVNDSYYKPYLKIVVNDSKKNKKKRKYNISVYDTMYFHVTLKGLNPYDEKGIKMKYKGVFSSGQTRADKWNGKWINDYSGYASFYYTRIGSDSYGELNFYVYDLDNNRLGTETAYFV